MADPVAEQRLHVDMDQVRLVAREGRPLLTSGALKVARLAKEG